MSYSHCQLCSKSIALDEPYGVMVFNIEKMNVTSEHPNGVINVLESEVVNTMCMDCAKKFNSESVQSLLD